MEAGESVRASGVFFLYQISSKFVHRPPRTGQHSSVWYTPCEDYSVQTDSQADITDGSGNLEKEGGGVNA
jgi:hypothetical protein